MQKYKEIFIIIFYKICVESGYWFILANDTETYTREFNLFKYIIGILWVVALVLCLELGNGKVSQFFCLFKIMFEIIPITAIYALTNESHLYYFVLCASFLLCELICRCTLDIRIVNFKRFKPALLLVIGPITLFVIGWIFWKNKLPSLMALNIYDVYKLRKANTFIITKYINYILQWIIYVIIPYKLTKNLLEHRYERTIIWSLVMVVLYLYTGHKTYLFALPLIIIMCIWAQRKKFVFEFMTVFSGLYSLMVLGATFNEFIWKVYGLIGRRVLIVPANLKFKYFDFFSQYPHIGILGILPTWINPQKSPYEKNIGNLISEIYFNKPEMNSNTGFLAEGFMRFGIIGIPMTLLLFAFLLKLMDYFQKKTSLAFTVGVCIYLIFDLSDGELWKSLFIGPWAFLIVFVLLYSQKENHIKGKLK